MTVRKNQHDRWMIDVQIEHADGRVERVRKTAPVQTKRRAEQYERAVRQAMLDGSRKNKRDEPRDVPTFAEYWTSYITDSANSHRNFSTRSIYEEHLGPFFGSMRLDQIRARQIDRFKASRLRPKELTLRPLDHRTVNNCLAALRRSLAVAVEWGILSELPRFSWLKTP